MASLHRIVPFLETTLVGLRPIFPSPLHLDNYVNIILMKDHPVWEITFWVYIGTSQLRPPMGHLGLTLMVCCLRWYWGKVPLYLSVVFPMRDYIFRSQQTSGHEIPLILQCFGFSDSVLRDLYLLAGDGSTADMALKDADCSPAFINLILIHGILMAAGWGFCLPWGVFIARYLKHWDPLWFQLHKFFQVCKQ